MANAISGHWRSVRLDRRRAATTEYSHFGEVAGKVAAHFPADLKITYGGVTVRVAAVPTVVRSIDDVLVSVPYECFA